MARWTSFLEDFDYEIEQRPANRLKHVDALSQSPILYIISSLEEETIKIIASQEKDKHLKKIKILVDKGEVKKKKI